MDVDNNQDDILQEGGGGVNRPREEHQPEMRQNRRRVILAPLEDELLNSPIITRTREVSIDALRSDEVYEMNMNRNYIDVQLLRIITPRSRDQKAYLYSLRSGRRGGGSKDVNFTRIFQCRVYSTMNTSEHKRIIYLMESRNSNNNMFERNLDFRDNGTVTIGTFLRVIAPEAIEDFMNGDIPLIRTPCSLIVLKRPASMDTVAVNYEIGTNKTLAFCLNNRILHLNKTLSVATTCNGLMCDKSCISEWNNNIKGCGCVGMNPNVSNLALVHSIWISSVAEMALTAHERIQRRISHTDFSSTKFSLSYLTNRIPPTVNKSSLSQGNRLYWDLEECIEDVVDFVNDNDGWTVVGWYKRGSIKDRSLIESSGGNNTTNGNEDAMVGSGKLSFHIVELTPTNQVLLDRNTALGADLAVRKFDVSRFTNHD